MTHLHDGLNSGPLAIFDEFGKVLVISSFDHFMSSSYDHDTTSSTLSWGIMGRVATIPAGFSCSTILVHSSDGFNKVWW